MLPMNIKLVSLLTAALILVGCCKTEEIPAQTRKLYSQSAKDRNEAALELARCSSPDVDRAVSRLIELLYDRNVGVQSSAAYALRRIDSPAARRALEKASTKH